MIRHASVFILQFQITEMISKVFKEETRSSQRWNEKVKGFQQKIVLLRSVRMENHQSPLCRGHQCHIIDLDSHSHLWHRVHNSR